MADYDMVVIGSGFAGTAATLSFLETTEKIGQSGRVALIEAGKKGIWSEASRWARPFLRLNRDNTLAHDRVDRMEHDRRSPSELEYWRKLEDEVPNTVKFMESHGVEIVHRDEENAAMDFEEQHFVYLASGGKEILDFYLDYIAEYETADVLWGHEAIELATNEDGKINGIVVRQPNDVSRTITADTVVLACGGFEGDPEILTQHLGEEAVDLPVIARGLRYNRGAGLRMAAEAGAGAHEQPDMFHAELVDPRSNKYHSAIWGQNYGIVVNENCDRFHDEGEDFLFALSESIAYDTWRHQNQKSYFITDNTVMDRFEGSWVYETTDQPPEQSDTIAGLADKLGLDPAELEATVSEFNAACGSGDWNPVEMDGNKTSGLTPPKSNWANPILEAPFSGFPMTTHLSFTFGGLKVDKDGRVLSTNETPIPDLYAAGEITGLFHHKHPPATSVLRSNAFGRLIGLNIGEAASEKADAETG